MVRKAVSLANSPMAQGSSIRLGTMFGRAVAREKIGEGLFDSRQHRHCSYFIAYRKNLMQPYRSSLAPTLRRLPLFNDLSEGELALISERVTVHRYGAGAIVFSEGDPCRELLI